MNTKSIFEPSMAGSWYLDSEDSHHVTPNQNSMNQNTPYDINDQLTIDNETSLSISSIDNNTLNSKIFPLKIKDILHVLVATKNLLFI